MSSEIEKLRLEGMVSLSNAARHFGVSPASISRWCQKGATTKAGSRVKLEHVRTPGKVLTTIAAVERFLLSLGDRDQSLPIQSPAKLRRAAEDAGSALSSRWGI